MTGMFAVSKAGRDKGQMYVVVKDEGDFLYLADGESRRMDHTKKKKKKHVQIVKTGMDEILAKKLQKGAPVSDNEIKAAVKQRIRQKEQQALKE